MRSARGSAAADDGPQVAGRNTAASYSSLFRQSPQHQPKLHCFCKVTLSSAIKIDCGSSSLPSRSTGPGRKKGGKASRTICTPYCAIYFSGRSPIAPTALQYPRISSQYTSASYTSATAVLLPGDLLFFWGKYPAMEARGKQNGRLAWPVRLAAVSSHVT
ncbi:hypothetical protein K458DRAFT_185084 [Lentithecium fluviatile CBS 122367]|uniref:Uncharacterized protein n=1 Tax=Lentithecium fluviatile CBS 122367 TaxID=1168545 RepID=A0A6G1J953_9PLEO|nr:hypothetical protein K458DRAFT_185084 [Lentithecium fluviatile CBS 122367]